MAFNKLKFLRSIFDAVAGFDPTGERVLGLIEWVKRLSQSESLKTVLEAFKGVMLIVYPTGGAAIEFIDFLLGLIKVDASALAVEDLITEEDIEACVVEMKAQPHAQGLNWSQIIEAVTAIIALIGRLKAKPA